MHKKPRVVAVSFSKIGSVSRALSGDRLFLIGLAIKLSLIFFVAPDIAQRWFVPFIQDFLTNPSLDPWAHHLLIGGDPLAFPYGPVMLVALLPGLAIATTIGWLIEVAPISAGIIGLGLSALILDFATYLVLRAILKERQRLVTTVYWLSPITFYVLYWHGQLDIVPVFFLVVSLLFLQRNNFKISGIAMGLAISAKLSMVLAAPFVGIYLYRNIRLAKFFIPYVGSLVVAVLLIQGPFFFSAAVTEMVLGTPQAEKIFEIAIILAGESIFILPLVYLLVLYYTWRIRRISFSLLLCLLGLGFFLVLLLTPAAPGWFLWLAPFLVFAQVADNIQSKLLFLAFSSCFVLFSLITAEGALIPVLGLDFSLPMSESLRLENSKIPSIVATCLTAFGILMAARMMREGIQRNDYYRLSRAPLVIGIAGDSGSGKDTLAEAMEMLFGKSSVARLSGDDYHNWDRNEPMWKLTTHLNPRANHLDKFNADSLALADGRAVTIRHYSHTTGRYGYPLRVEPQDIILITGLHTFYPVQLRSRLDVKIFLDIDEQLRQTFKINRDMRERGHSRKEILDSIETRQPDGERFIQPQIHNADLVFSLGLRGTTTMTNRAPSGDDFILNIRINHCLYFEDLLRCLIGLCGLNVTHKTVDGSTNVDITVDGQVNPEYIALSATFFLNNLDELLDLNPKFEDGMLGVMQLVTIAHSAQSLRSRLS